MGHMKKYSQFLKELPSKTVVFAFGRFNPPTTGHELLVKAVKKLAVQNKAEHAIYASKTQDAKKNPLTVDKKVHYLNLMFPSTHFVAANEQERTFIEAVKNLNKRYKNIIMVAGSDRVPEYEKILTKYNGKDFNYDTIQVISAGERDPDADDASGMSASKMRAVASKGDYSQFKKGLPSSMRDIDGRRLMNDVRHGMGLEMVKEQLNLVKDNLREQYFRGEIFNIGDIVESVGVRYEIVKRGSNHLLLKEQSGKLVSKWIQDVQLSEDVSPVYTPEEIKSEMQDSYKQEGDMLPEELTDKTLKKNDKIKVARIIASILGIDNPESSANPEMLVNLALRRVRTKPLNAEGLATLEKMLQLATDIGIKFDGTLKPTKLKEESPVVDTNSKRNMSRLNYGDYVKLSNMNKGIVPGSSLTHAGETDTLRKMKLKHMHEETDEEGADDDIKNAVGICPMCGKDPCECENEVGPKNATLMSKPFDPFFKESAVDMSDYEKDYGDNIGDEEISDEELDKMANEINDIDDVMDAYEDHELAFVDEDSGEEVEDTEEENELKEGVLLEVLSRIERMKARMRIKRTAAKRERKIKIALKRYSDTGTINKRARRLAIKLMKKRLLRGRDPAKISVGEKERVERVIERRKKVIGRLAMRLAPRVRKIEKARMTHTKFTAPAPAVAM
jgi:phosphopantetheine adenylyltransferase